MTIHIDSKALFVVGVVALVGIAAVAGGWIPLSALLWLGLVLLCPLMMVFMMQGMHGGGDENHDARPQAPLGNRSDRPDLPKR